MLKLYARAAMYRPPRSPAVFDNDKAKQANSRIEADNDLTINADTFSDSEAALAIPVLPSTRIHKQVKINPRHCNKYNLLSAWDNAFGALLHPNYIQTLSLPMQLSMMVSEPFPFKPIGLVHLANNIDITVLPEQSSELLLSTYFGNVYFHRKGWLFEVITTAHNKNQRGSHDLKATSYYLARTRHKSEDVEYLKAHCEAVPSWIEALAQDSSKGGNVDKSADKSLNKSADKPIITQTRMQFKANTGRKYAKVSGDYNPIHLFPFTAKLLGFKKAIAHGMYSKAWAISEIVKRNGVPASNTSIRAAFVQPIFLPLDTTLYVQGDDSSASEFSLRSHSDVKHSNLKHSNLKSRLHLRGSIKKHE